MQYYGPNILDVDIKFSEQEANCEVNSLHNRGILDTTSFRYIVEVC
jgi:hypothetical protein